MTANKAQQRVVAVTGGGRGIGKNMVRAFAMTGARVYVCDVDEQLGRVAETEMQTQGLNVELLVADLRRPLAATKMIREIVSSAGRIDVLVNNARSGKPSTFPEETEASWDEGVSVTLKAAFFASQEAIKAMVKTGGGAIVNISSIAGFLAAHESPAYHISKAGVIQMTRYMAVAAGKLGVRVNCICPGFIVQDEHRPRYEVEGNAAYREIAEYCHPMGKVGAADDVAQAAVFLCSPQAGFITGQIMVLDGGATLQEQFCLLKGFASSHSTVAKCK